MSSSLSLGRIAGIRIGLHWSWLVVFGLMVWTLSENVFPRQNPGLAEADYRGMAIAAAVLLFVSLLLHELGHALQARRDGMEIEGITLWLFGGVATFRGAFPGPGAEFRIAVAGPLVSLVVGLAFAASPRTPTRRRRSTASPRGSATSTSRSSSSTCCPRCRWTAAGSCARRSGACARTPCGRRGLPPRPVARPGCC